MPDIRIFHILSGSLRHSNILTFLGYYTDLTHLSLVLEYAPRGDLLHYMTQFRTPHERLIQTRLFLRQMVQAVEYLQMRCVAHRDIKPENIVVTSQDCCKLCDFGWSVRFRKAHCQRTLCGTPEYVPPEMLLGKYYAEFVDVWALGVLGFELMHADTPFSEQVADNVESDASVSQPSTLIFNKIRRFRGFQVDCRHSDGSDEMVDYANLVSRLMQVDPNARISMADALKHPFLHHYEVSTYESFSHSRKGNSLPRTAVVSPCRPVASPISVDHDM